MHDYKNNIKVTTTPNGDVVITMSKSIHTVLMNNLYDAHQYQKENKLYSTSKDTFELWRAIDTKDEDDE